MGPDPSLAMNKVAYKLTPDPDTNPTGEIWEYKKKYADKDPVLNPEAYLYDYNLLERRQRFLSQNRRS